MNTKKAFVMGRIFALAAVYACSGGEPGPLGNRPDGGALDAGRVDTGGTCSPSAGGPVSVQCNPPATPITNCPSILQCKPALEATPLRVTEQSSERLNQREYFRAWVCDTQNSSQVLDYASDDRYRAGFERFFSWRLDLGIGRSRQRTSVEQWQQSRCEEEVRTLELASVRDFLSTIVDGRANLAAWVDCVQRVSQSYDSCIQAG
ncbi:MAG: hypothetical protein AAFV29_18960, partial [Myxococcota bacterium]